MTTTANRDNFFQTSAALDDQERKDAKSQNTNGSPIRLKSKILAIHPDPANPGSIYVAQSTGIVRRIVLETGETTAIYKGPTAPLTSLCLSPNGKLIFAGCWDKTVWSWDIASREPKQRYEGHSDFVKSVITARLQRDDYLLTGGADAKIFMFKIGSNERIRAFDFPGRAVQDMLLDPDLEGSEAVLFSADSDREIRQFKVLGGDAPEPLIAHETSVYKLFFDQDGDLWTASADKTAKCLVRADGWNPNLTLEHPDFVRDVVVYEPGGWVVTACRDEEVRVWNRSTGELHHLSVQGIDGTIRQWSLRSDELQKAVDQAKQGARTEEDQPSGEPMLTEEEERELAELMADD
ncbi:hypothetical protein N7468_002214 [Penicillium chermesinum]|uniref:WD repeat protein n=1 Tax=Penicillium chermesinum TaxID=63820 RepID=A0A9W9PI33_9EURO|nr:uncharacterized protein N7468_002214 [Penicillium chermesinum]KAJ5247231.1 hypothetical protein N7468_002214 [Penicillium chermesinum]